MNSIALASQSRQKKTLPSRNQNPARGINLPFSLTTFLFFSFLPRGERFCLAEPLFFLTLLRLPQVREKFSVATRVPRALSNNRPALRANNRFPIK